MILVDAHVAAWLVFDPHRLSNRAKVAIATARRNADAVAVCDISLLELTALVNKGRIRLNVTLESFLREVESRFVVLPIGARECARSMQLPTSYPRYPADRIIAATALVQGLPLLTLVIPSPSVASQKFVVQFLGSELQLRQRASCRKELQPLRSLTIGL